jgi:hypothetical protein
LDRNPDAQRETRPRGRVENIEGGGNKKLPQDAEGELRHAGGKFKNSFEKNIRAGVKAREKKNAATEAASKPSKEETTGNLVGYGSIR